MITYREIRSIDLLGSFNRFLCILCFFWKRIMLLLFQLLKSKSFSYPEEFQLALNNDPLENAKIDTDNSKSQFQRIYEFLEKFKTNKLKPETARKWKKTLESMISKNSVIRMVVTAFPVKSLDTEKMVLSRDIDVTDFWCLRMFAHICKEIKSIYPPGAKIAIYSDGIPVLHIASAVTKLDLRQIRISDEEKKVFEILYSVLEKLEEGAEKYKDNCGKLLQQISDDVTFISTKNFPLSSNKEHGCMVNSLRIKKEYYDPKKDKDYNSRASFWKKFIGEKIFEGKQQYIDEVIERFIKIYDEAAALLSEFQKEDQKSTEYLHLSYRPRKNSEQKVSCVFIYGHGVKAVPWSLVPILGYKEIKEDKEQKRFLSLSFKHKNEIHKFREENIKSFTLGGIELKYYNAIDDEKQQIQNAGLKGSEKTENGEGKEGEERKRNKANKGIPQIVIAEGENGKEKCSKPMMSKRAVLSPSKGKSLENLQKELEEDTRVIFISKVEDQFWIYLKEIEDISNFKDDTTSKAWPEKCCPSYPFKLITDEKFNYKKMKKLLLNKALAAV